MEPVVEDIKPRIDLSIQVTKGSITDQVACSFEDDHILENLKDKRTKSVDQQMQASEKIKELSMVSKVFHHLIDLITSPLPEKPIKSLDEKAIDQEVAKEDQVIDIPHIDFIFKDRQLIYSKMVSS